MTSERHNGQELTAETRALLQKNHTRLVTEGLPALSTAEGRFDDFSRGLDGLLFDFSRVLLDAPTLDVLLDGAREIGLEAQRDALFAGDNVNSTEQRPALHMALRSPDVLAHVGGDEAARVTQAMKTMLVWADLLHEGELPGAPDKRVRHIIHVGIGGSLLGTQLVVEALDRGTSPLTVHFLGSVDAVLRERLMRQLDPAETMVVLVSKSFSTGDTLLHGRRLRDWLARHLGEEEGAGRLFAVTSQVERAGAFGIAPERLLYFSDWVGGRYSLWSPVSLSAAGVIGSHAFRELLAGAAAMDRHFQRAPLEDNLPVLYGLIGAWHRNICGHAAWGVMPYDQRLRLLPAWMQQLVMESNGKSVTRDGRPVPLKTAPVVFGETGTEAQHSVFQAMHQGADVVPLNFIGVIRPDHDDREAQNELLANLFAQLKALAEGRDAAATRAGIGDIDDDLLAQRTFAGNRPSELILLDRLDPKRLGMLLALYEHKVFVESVLWNINAFDQWGVELGKTLAPGIQSALAGKADAPAGVDAIIDYVASVRTHG
ncbi:glucose-6-phosphate isomerase [Marinihelvus fidelis]|uniref:Glucose-6-phosphate isomerase n=1 Tax=Marinihelvus fidelis TaxID=2613842 RepID=A0A5N0T7W0_9GAMM|nr:glucose-6-phosphate isomerase [Marinihelvus fidelis]KAA9130237.1 glucose-6-phosphate isomerase [Marinihelvus fidelis]